jgi:hypothetical protein
MQTLCLTVRSSSQQCQRLLWCLVNKVANHGEPLLIVGSQCDYRYADGMRHIAQHGN